MSRGGWAAAAVALIALGVAIALVVLLADGDESTARPEGRVADALDAASRADAPFPELTETTIRVGDEPLDVVVADESDERFQGLRRRETIGAYDGMLFVFEAPTSTSFTMSTVPVPLDIGFYEADGRLVDRLRMEPCDDTQDRCPLYSAEGSFTYALETLAGDLPEGDLSA